MTHPTEPSKVLPQDVGALDVNIGRAETLIYALSALLLIVAAVFTLVGTIVDLIKGSGSRAITDTGVFLLDRVLLLFIVAELLYTLRLVNLGGRILVEPFLFIGLIAVVRKVLVVTAEFQQGHRAIVDALLEIAALAGLAVALSLSIHVLRRSATQQP
jgi:uncharacterized membrane protein (DUF373 family)